MTSDQIEVCAAFYQITFLPGSWDKRFAMNLASLTPDRDLTAKQEEWMYRILYKYRRQIPDIYKRHRAHPHCGQAPKRQRGTLVQTKSGKEGKVINGEAPVNGKVIVHTEEGNLLCDPNQLKLVGYFD